MFEYLFNGNGATAPFPQGYHASRSSSKFFDESDFIKNDIIWQRLQDVVKGGVKIYARFLITCKPVGS